MKINNTITEVRKSGNRLLKKSNSRISVIVLTPYSTTNANYGIQFWTTEMIKIGTSINTDNTISTFIEKL